MTFAIGQRSNKPCSEKAFTLVELILVMTILCVAMAIAAPSMSSFFRGRAQDSEARRFLSLIRYGQSRAVSEGVPTRLWIDEDNGTYGLELEIGYTDEDRKAVDFEIDKNLSLEVDESISQTPRKSDLPAIVFQPDASVSANSPERIGIHEGDNEPIWIVQAHNGLTYEIESHNKAIENTFR